MSGTILALWKRQPGTHFVICVKSGAGKWHEEFFTRDEFGKVAGFIRENNANDIYFCPHGFSRPVRRKEYAELPSLLWADLDKIDPREIELKPTIAIESSPGRHVGLWITDGAITEELNRRLTYTLEADLGGWDLTQVLRIPGTFNYKYQATPRVKLMWDDGPRYSMREIERALPEKSLEISSESAVKVYQKYEKVFPIWLRNELLNGRPQHGKRSDMIWKIENEMVERGVTRDDAFILIKASPWNKFRGRRNEDEQLWRELDKVYRNKLYVIQGGKAEANGYKFLTQSIDDVEEENIDWLWYPYLARKEVTIIEGDPGIGKSYIALMMGKALVDGDKLPSTRKSLGQVKGKVAYFDTENTASTVTKKRLRYNDCINMSDFYQEEEPFSIDNGKATEELYNAIERQKPIAVFFDTINLYIGKADTGKGSETTQALSVFKDIARRFNCAVVLLRHLTKGNTRDKALYRGQGNIAFAGVSRIVLTIGADPEDAETKVMSVTKLNLARRPQALTFHVQELPDTLRDRDRSKFTWGEFVDLSSDDILGTPEKSKDKDEAVEFLKDILDGGGREVREIETMAEKRSISARTLRRASEELGVKKTLNGFGNGKTSVWSL